MTRQARYRSTTYPLGLERLEVRELLSWSPVSPFSVFPGPIPPEQATGTVPAVLGSDTQGGKKQPAKAPVATAPPQSTATYPSGSPDSTPDDASGIAFVGPSQTNQPSGTDAGTGNNIAEFYPQHSYPGTTGGYQADDGTKSNQVAQAAAAESYEYQTALAPKPTSQVVVVPILPRQQASSPPVLLPLPAPISGGPVVESRPVDGSDSAAGPVSIVPHGSRLSAEDARFLLSAEDARFLSPTQVQTTPEHASDTIVKEFIGSADSSASQSHPVPQLGTLLAGGLPIDLANLRAAVDTFFARLEDLAENMAASLETQKLVHWLFAGVTAIGIFECARRKTMPSAGLGDGDPDDPVWAPFPVLAFIPPED
jgi:hypothetical protein